MPSDSSVPIGGASVRISRSILPGRPLALTHAFRRVLLASQKEESSGISALAGRVGALHRPCPEIDRWPTARCITREDLGKLRRDSVAYPARPSDEVFRQGILAALVGLAEALRVLKDALLDQVGDRVEVNGGCVAAESQCFERDGAASGEAVQNLGRPIRVSVSHVACGVDRCGQEFVEASKGDACRKEP